MFNSFSAQSVKINEKMGEISIHSRLALPLGLLINEFATNAIKHGFNSQSEAIFSIELKKYGNQFSLIISNTGNPFPEDIDLNSSNTIRIEYFSRQI